jgi:3-deoxy-manno-octulosonate cytidylyltransferase (CMP-KDO synthetase)
MSAGCASDAGVGDAGAGEPGVLVVIPARLAATRLPRKPLLRRSGKYLVEHVWERACRIEAATAVLVATDSTEIAAAVASFGGEAVLTSPDCASGTDRVAEAAEGRSEALIVNLQGDEPEFDVEDVDRLVAAMIAAPSVPMGTIASPAEPDEIERPSVVKVVRSRAGRALYFSRAAIPHVRDPDTEIPAAALRHVGIYAFRRSALDQFAQLPPSPLECTEKLEQLRALENGWAIHVVIGRRAPPGIDTERDYQEFLARVERSTNSEDLRS